MKQLILVTGFLGAGKTTFVNHFIKLFPEKRIAVIVNEYGKVGIDGAIMAEKGYWVDEISQGSIFCVCRTDRFLDVLAEASKRDADLILVETSGLSDPTGIGDILTELWKAFGVEYNYRGCITLIDAKNFHKVISTTVAAPEQVRQASLAIINKSDLVPAEKIEALKGVIGNLNPDCVIRCAINAQIEKEAVLAIKPRKKIVQCARIDISSASLTIPGDSFNSLEELNALLDQIKNQIYRCKGYAIIGKRDYYIDGTMDQIEIRETEKALSDQIVVLYRSSEPIKRILKQKIFNMGGQ